MAAIFAGRRIAGSLFLTSFSKWAYYDPIRIIERGLRMRFAFPVMAPLCALALLGPAQAQESGTTTAPQLTRGDVEAWLDGFMPLRSSAATSRAPWSSSSRTASSC
jgi:hypothetical protein